jgi:Holliday junction resolvasome RuvABC endonuclease subunit
VIIGVNATKGAVFLATTSVHDGTFAITDTLRIQHAFEAPAELVELMNAITIAFEALGADDSVAILRCSGGQFGSSVSAIKAETIAELAAAQKGIDVVAIAPQSLKKALGGGTAHWKETASQMFNSNGAHMYWGQGMDGAVCAAYAASRL